MEGIQVKSRKNRETEDKNPDFTPGIKRTETGMHLCVEAPGTFCHLTIYETGKNRVSESHFTGRPGGDLWMMELAGDDFSGLEYTIETEQGSCRIRAGASIQDMSAGAI